MMPTHDVSAAGLARTLLDHRYRGSCPDDVEGWESRDPECPACVALDQLAEHDREHEHAPEES